MHEKPLSIIFAVEHPEGTWRHKITYLLTSPINCYRITSSGKCKSDFWQYSTV